MLAAAAAKAAKAASYMDITGKQLTAAVLVSFTLGAAAGMVWGWKARKKLVSALK